MMPTKLSRRIVSDRLAWIDKMLAEIRALPLQSRAEFFTDRRNIHAAESCLRRALEALFDLGRHILAKGFAQGTSEYKEIAQLLEEKGVLPSDIANILRILAGYRNRMVHFYHEVSDEELYKVCVNELKDVEIVTNAFRSWVQAHPNQIDETL